MTPVLKNPPVRASFANVQRADRFDEGKIVETWFEVWQNKVELYHGKSESAARRTMKAANVKVTAKIKEAENARHTRDRRAKKTS